MVGMKPAGGIRTAKQAIQYLCVLHETLGLDWLTPDLFRFGASSLLNDVLMQLRKQTTGIYQSPRRVHDRLMGADRETSRSRTVPAPDSSGSTRRHPRRATSSAFQERYGLFIGGEEVEPRSRSGSRPSRRRREEPLAEVAQAGAEDVDLAVDAAREAFDDVERVGSPSERAQVPVPDRAHPPGALARARRRRVARRRQADQGVARRRPAARGRALLLLRRLGRQARVRIPEPSSAAARRRRADHPVELPAADARVEDRARARVRQHRRAQAGRDDAADGAALHRRLPPGRAAARRRQHRHRRRLDRARTSSSNDGDRQGRVHGLDRGRQGDPARARRARRSR